MDLKFSVTARIARPVAQVFEWVANPAKLSCYFTTGGAKGRLETGATVYWDFRDFPGAFPVEVVEVQTNRRIVLRWASSEAAPEGDGATTASRHSTTVTMTFEPLDDHRTLVTISEEGWHPNEVGLEASYRNCQGWSQMLCALKAYVEHGINLREGMYT